MLQHHFALRKYFWSPAARGSEREGAEENLPYLVQQQNLPPINRSHLQAVLHLLHEASFHGPVSTDCYQSAAATWESVKFPPCWGSWQVAQVCYEEMLWRNLGMTPTLPQEMQRKASRICYIKHLHSVNH